MRCEISEEHYLEEIQGIDDSEKDGLCVIWQNSKLSTMPSAKWSTSVAIEEEYGRPGKGSFGRSLSKQPQSGAFKVGKEQLNIHLVDS